MLQLNPRHLKVFLAVARTGSVARAAETVSRVQSAITRAIQELEADLSVPLFERRAQGMRLTAFGDALRPRVQAVFDEMEAARAAIGALCGAGAWNPGAPIFSLGIGRQRLQVFAELLKQGHMGAVAHQFGVTPSAVSLALREVEQGIGVPLVARLPTGMVANPVGECLGLHLRRALAEMARAEDDIASVRQGVTGQVVVGTLSLGRNWLLPQAMLRVATTHPRIHMATEEGSFEHLATLLRAGEIDFILGGLRPQHELVDLRTRSLMRSGIVLLARQGHPLVQAGPRAALEGTRWVLPHRGTWTRSALETFLQERGDTAPQVVVETADTTLTRALVAGSELVTAASPHLFRTEAAAGDLVVLPQRPEGALRDIGIVTRAGGTASVAASVLIEAVLAIQPD